MYRAAEGSVCMNTFFPHCPLRQGGSLLAGHTRWQHQPSLLCSSRHRFNKEKFVQHLFIWKSRVWHSNAGSSRLRWMDTQVSWRTLTTLQVPQNPPPRTHSPLSPPPSASYAPHRCTAFSLPCTSKRRRQSERLKCRVAHSFIFNCILYSKEYAVFFISSASGHSHRCEYLNFEGKN